jgi:hypothetical protein
MTLTGLGIAQEPGLGCLVWRAMRTTCAHGRAPGRCARIVRMRRREYYPTEGPPSGQKPKAEPGGRNGAGPSPDLAVDLSRESGRGDETYWIVL